MLGEDSQKIKFMHGGVWYEVSADRVRETEVVQLPGGTKLKVEGWKSDAEFESLLPLQTYWGSVAAARPVADSVVS